MPRIFISYRRDDSAGQAGRLYDHLVRHYGEDEVFMDVDGIDLGTGFAAALERALADCEALLVVIGRNWTQLADAATGRPRILLDDDWVRREVATTLARDLPVIPVLVQGASLPAADALPPDLQPLLGRQATTLDDRKWAADVATLVRRLEAAPRRRREQALAARLARIGPRRIAFLASLLLVVLAAGGWLAWPVRMPDLTGKPLAAAQSAGLPGGAPEITEQESLTAPPGQVIDQSPEAGVRVSRFERARLVVAKLPPAVDLSAHVRIRDIGSEGTIAAAALVVAMEVAYAAGGRNVELSERYLYERAKWSERDKATEGSFMSLLVATAEQYGAPPLAQWPYVVGQHSPPAGQTWDKLDEAATGHTVRCIRLDGLDDVYAALRRKRPVLAAVAHSEVWGGDTAVKTGVVKISGELKEEGTMAITLIGFDPAHGVYRFAHGWGATWGDRGFGSIDRASLQSILQPHGLWAVEPEARPGAQAASAAGL